MPAVLKSHKDWSTKVKTRDLNDWLQMAMQRHPPPSVGGKRIKPKYMAQTKARPPTFVLFSSRADQMPEQYRRYLINSLRESFDLPGVPLRITIKSGANPYAEGEAKGHSGKGKREFERGARGRAHPRLAQHRQEVGARGRSRRRGRREAAGLPDPGEAAVRQGPPRQGLTQDPPRRQAVEIAAPAAEPGKAAVKSVKKQGPKAQKKSTTPSYKVGFKAAGGKAARNWGCWARAEGWGWRYCSWR
jgi:GTP-binding protein